MSSFVIDLLYSVYPDGRVCISILHAPGDDPMGYESSAERWSPVQSVEKILLSVVSMLAGNISIFDIQLNLSKVGTIRSHSVLALWNCGLQESLPNFFFSLVYLCILKKNSSTIQYSLTQSKSFKNCCKCLNRTS